MARRIRRNSPERFNGSDVLLQPSTLQADNHKKRTGFGPQQASFGVYVSNAFGGMSGALNLMLSSAGGRGVRRASHDSTRMTQKPVVYPQHPRFRPARTTTGGR